MIHPVGKIAVLIVWLQLLYSGVAAQPFHIEHLGTEHGLSQGSVYAMLHDSRGFMWFGTQDGLNRYDGSKFVYYRPSPSDTASVAGININRILEGPDGDLWIGTEQGISRYLRHFDRFHRLMPTNSRIPPGVSTPLAVSESAVWYWAQNEGLVRMDLSSGARRVVNASLAFRRSYFTSSEPGKFARDGSLWFLMEQGLARIDTSTGKTETFFTGGNLPALAFNCISISAQSYIWLGDNQGITGFDPTRNAYVRIGKLPNGKPIGDVYDLDEDSAGALWLSTDRNGLLRFRPENGTLTEFVGARHNDDRLTNREISSMYIDPQGVFWLNTDPVGIDKIVWNPGRFDAILPSMASGYLGTQLESNSVRGMIEIAPGTLWLGTQRNGILEYDSRKDLFRKEAVFGVGEGLPSLTIRYLLRDVSGTIWVGTPRGLARYLPAQKRFETYVNSSSDGPLEEQNFIRHIHEWDSRYLLIATESGGYIFDKQSHRFDLIKLLARKKVSLFHRLSPNKLLVGVMNGGLYELKWEGIHSSLEKKWILDLTPTSILYDSKRKSFWIGTDLGLIRYSATGGAQKRYTESEWLANSFVYGVLLDHVHNVWLSTNRGLSSLHPETGNIRNFSPSDGLQGYEFNGYSSLKTADGELFFGGTKGLNRFRPESIRLNTLVPNTQLTSILINGSKAPFDEYIGEMSGIALRPDENTFAIGYVAPDFRSGNQNRYQHRLLGLDDQWTEVGNQQTVRYFKIPPGEYTFEVLASNNDGVWSSTPTQLRISIAPPFWQTNWFRLLVILCVVAGSYGWYTKNINTLKRRQEEALALITNTQEAERKHLANELHDDLGVRLSTLQLYLQGLPASTEKADLVAMLHESVREIRQLLRELNPRLLFENGLQKTLDELAQKINRVAPPTLRIQYYDFPATLSDEMQINLYRIAQELINNGLKHAEAKQIDLQWFCRDNELILTYEDDGRGLGPTGTKEGFGIQNIRQRVHLLKGTIEWDSSPRAGLRVQIVVPFFTTY